jgi:DnaK suppressor protein
MNQRQLNEFRKLLNDQLEELIGQFQTTMSGMSDAKAVFADPTDRASMETDRNFELRIRDRERMLINKIREALARIDDGSFGICEECGEPIGMQRLRARPVTTLCIGCKEAAEAKEPAT